MLYAYSDDDVMLKCLKCINILVFFKSRERKTIPSFVTACIKEVEARGKYRLLKTCWLDWLTILFDTCSMFKFKLWENLYYNTKYFPNLDRQRDNLVIKVWTVHRTLEIVWIGDQFALCFLKGWRKLECTEYLEWPLRSRGSRKPLTKVKHLFFTKFTYTKQNTAVWGSLHLCSWPSSCFYFQIQYNVMRSSR